MGRLDSIDYPDNDSVAWANTTRLFARVATAEYGIAGGHWREIVSTGNARKVTYYDALWRPVVSEAFDAGNLNATLSQSVTRYDADGRSTFTSYPQRSLAPAVYNTWANPAG